MKSLTILLCLLTSFCIAQDHSDDEYVNLVPNAGFERYANPPIGWFYKGDHYTQVMKYWSAATVASPDAFGPRVRVPATWAQKGFGEQLPRNGNSMSGITVYGCDKGKPHCREYIQIQLAEPLVKGQRYEASMWVSHLPRSLQTNNLGFHFSEKKIGELTDKVLNLRPDIFTEKVLDAQSTGWVNVSGEFKVDFEANYLVIGNFFPDSLTLTRIPCSDHLNFGYYYIDDVFVKKLPPILPIPVRKDDLTKAVWEPGKIIHLKNIFFEFDEAELLPRSFVELRKLLKIMRKNPKMTIEIQGHTDDRGTDTYNQNLSERRALAVAAFLVQNDIAPGRVKARGYGSKKPIDSNETDFGRQQNRRVSLLVIEK